MRGVCKVFATLRRGFLLGVFLLGYFCVLLGCFCGFLQGLPARFRGIIWARRGSPHGLHTVDLPRPYCQGLTERGLRRSPPVSSLEC